jgi:N-acyl homoserine lactone hydrolase
MSLTIRPLGVGQALDVPLASMTHGHGWGEKIDASMIMFLIEGGPSPILVDTGTLDPEFTRTHHGHHLVRTPEAEPRAILATAGYDLEDIKIVVNTHLHWDHCSNNGLFTKADFIVQKRELEYAIDPLPIHRRGYEKVPGLVPQWMSTWSRIHAVAGDEQIAEGVRVVALPGHTPGSQGVLVDTADGPHLIAGDTVDLHANWNGSPSLSHIPSSIHTNLFEYYESFQKIEDLGCTVIPSHDPAVLANETFG